MLTKKQMRNLNQACGYHFFDQASMLFFNSKIESNGFAYGENFLFITSEKFNLEDEKKYTLRSINASTGAVDTIGLFQAYSSLKDARKELFKTIKQ